MSNDIDPATCDKDTPYLVRIPGIAHDVIGQRVDPDDPCQWLVLVSRNVGVYWRPDSRVTVIGPVDKPLPEWGILRRTVQIVNREAAHTALSVAVNSKLDELADRLEAEHKAAQEKVTEEWLIELLAENAFEHIADVGFGSLSGAQQEKWREAMRRTRAAILDEVES